MLNNYLAGKLVDYTVDLSTSYMSWGGTNEWVYLTIIGSTANTTEKGLDILEYNDMK
jgi:hypothetical protein